MLKEITKKEYFNEYEVGCEGSYIIKSRFMLPAEDFLGNIKTLIKVKGMLKEIPRSEYFNNYEVGCEDSYILKSDIFMPAENFFDGIRILVEVDDSEDVEPEEEEEPEEEPEPETEPKPEKKYMSSRDRQAQILKAWDGGRRTIKEVMEITGASNSTVYRYLPRNADG